MTDARVVASDETRIHSAGGDVTPLFATIAAASSGAITVVSGVTARRLRVIAGFWTAPTTGASYWTSGTGGTAIAGSSAVPQHLAATGGMVLPLNVMGWFESSDGADLVLNATTSGMSGGVTYFEYLPPA